MRIPPLFLALLCLPLLAPAANEGIQCGPEGKSENPYTELRNKNIQTIIQLNKPLSAYQGISADARNSMVGALNGDLIQLCQIKKSWEAFGAAFVSKVNASTTGGCAVFGELLSSYGKLESGATLYGKALDEKLKKQLGQFDRFAREDLKNINLVSAAAKLMPNFKETWASKFDGSKSPTEANKLGSGFFAGLLQSIEAEKKSVVAKQKSFADMKAKVAAPHANCPTAGNEKIVAAGEQGQAGAGNDGGNANVNAGEGGSFGGSGVADGVVSGDSTLSGGDKQSWLNVSNWSTGKSLLVLGGLGAAGAGAYYLLKNKKSDAKSDSLESLTSGGDAKPSDGQNTGTGTSTSTSTGTNNSVPLADTGKLPGEPFPGSPQTKMHWSAWIDGIIMQPGTVYQSQEEFEAMVGKKMTINGNMTKWFIDKEWSNFDTLFNTPGDPTRNWANIATAKGQIPMLAWQTYDSEGNTFDCSDPKHLEWLKRFRNRNIANGDFDDYIRKWAKQMKAWGKPIYLRPMHELNFKTEVNDLCASNGWFTPWGADITVKGEVFNKPQDSIDAWRHMVDIFREEGATNVKWAWTLLSWPSAAYGGNNGATLKSIYPGDEYVDWIGIECYVFKDKPWESCRKVMNGIYREATALSDKVPLFVAEMGIYEDPRKGEWLKDALSSESPNAIHKIFPRINGIMYWNASGDHLWVNSSPAATKAFKEAIAAPIYLEPGKTK